MRKTMSINKRNQQEHTEISLKKIHKHFKNLETKTKIVVFFFNNFWIGLHSHRHTPLNHLQIDTAPFRPPRICYPLYWIFTWDPWAPRVKLIYRLSTASGLPGILLVELRPANDNWNRKRKLPDL